MGFSTSNPRDTRAIAGKPAADLDMPWRVRELADDFVAQIDGVPLGRHLSDPECDALQRCWARFPVLVLPDQPLDHSTYERFAGEFGVLGQNPYLRGLDAHPDIVEVRREAHETTPIFGASWHSDWSFLAEPPSATLLHAKHIPPIGGDTCFADASAAYAALPETLRRRIDGRRAVHTAAPSYGPRGLFAKDDHSRSMRIVVSPDAEQTVTHPIVRTHPVSGRKGLFINHVYTTAIEGMEPLASRTLLATLFAHMILPRFVYRHRWRADMLVIWDNRCVLHYADGGYAGHQRLMHRITLAGEAPA
ncbi:MAG: TauD/TfdA dioxygenase family protein [Gammaproteobacteria bacterium]|jgi:taurine dioxygenase